MEETPKRKKSKHNKTQEMESVTSAPKRKRTGDAYTKKQIEQEYEEISIKKKRRKTESHLEADDVTPGEGQQRTHHQKYNEKVKKTFKDSNRLHGDKAFGTEEAPCSDLEVRTKKKKKKLKKDSRERLLEDSIGEETLTCEAKHGTRKKKKREGGGGLQEDDDENNLQHGFTELVSERKYPGCSVTPKQLHESVKKTKKGKFQEADDITVDEEKIKKFCKAKGLNVLNLGEGLPEEALYMEPADLEYSGKHKKKKHKKDCRESIVEDTLVEESLTPDAQHTSKKKTTKRKDGGSESHSQNSFTGELVTKRKHHGGSKTIEQVDECFDQVEDILEEQLLVPETQHAYKKKKKRKDGSGGLQEKNDESNLQHGFTEKLIFDRKYPGGSETLEQVDESVKKKRKKKRKDESKEADDLTTDEENDLKGLHRDEEALYSEPADAEHRPNMKKKAKKDRRERILDDSLGKELLTAETQHRSKKKKAKQKDGGDKSHRPDCFTGEFVTKRKHQGGLETIEQVDESVDWAEDSLVGDLLVPETQHAYKKKKKWKGGGDLQEDVCTGEPFTPQKCPDNFESSEQVDARMVQEEKPVKKRKRRGEPHQEADDITADDAASSVCLPAEESSYSQLHDTEAKPSCKKKKKSKKDHGERPLEDHFVEESLTRSGQHPSKKKKKRKRKGGEDESHEQHCFMQEPVEYQGDSENTNPVDETVDRAAERVKKRKTKNKHSDMREEASEILTEETHLEDDDAPTDSTQTNQLLQSQIVVSNGESEEDTEKISSSRSRTQTSAPTDTDQNPTTQDEREMRREGGDERSATSDQNTRKYLRKAHYIREADLALLNEYFPKTNQRVLRTVTIQELERIRMAKKNGIMFRSGQFTIDEDEQIKKNVQKFMSEVGIDSAEHLFCTYKFPEKKRTLEEIKRKFHFGHRIAEGLNRRISDIFNRAKKIFDLSTKRGRFSEEEADQLMMYYELYGKNWRKISLLMNRTTYSSSLKFSQIRLDPVLGVWSTEEMNRLITAVKQFVLNSLGRDNGDEPVTIAKEKLYTGISWVQIEEEVKTRNWTHCKREW
ncbi:hypothetical protein GDO78_020545 [Eleutherodactylus coqui]|uniref:Transcription termination factor 1 n=1 Tax=Eleutherodactylus coqui TaxID=57060 RepID=A0A8J6EHR4_ELECQ|nr:hypothetical protein GDO78_020545 [Eleutherodactylus coqui]